MQSQVLAGPYTVLSLGSGGVHPCFSQLLRAPALIGLRLWFQSLPVSAQSLRSVSPLILWGPCGCGLNVCSPHKIHRLNPCPSSIQVVRRYGCRAVIRSWGAALTTEIHAHMDETP